MALALSDVAKLIDIRKVPAEVWVAVAAASGFVMLAPDSWATRLAIEPLRRIYGLHCGSAFVVSSAILVAKALVFGGRIVKDYAVRWRDRQQLRYLSPDQKAVLRRYIEEDICTQNFFLENGSVQGLCHVGLVYQSAQMGSIQRGFAFNIKPWLYVYLRKHPEAIAS